MPREKKKKVILKPVEERPKASVVIRLGPEMKPEDSHPPVRLGPLKKIAEARLVEDADTKAFRSHQPDIDELINKPVANEESAELTWGEEAHLRKPRSWGWFALAGLLLTIGVVWSLLSVKKADLLAKKIQLQTEDIIADEAAEQREVEELLISIESAIRAYFSATSLESRLRWVRFPDRVGPMMRRHEEEIPWKPSPPQSIRILQPLTIEEHTHFWMACVVLATGERRQLAIECTDAGPRIDWETLVCHQPMPWDEFAAKRPEGRSLDFRVYVQPDTFYSHEFGNENDWACYRLSARGAEEVIFGYVRRGTEMEAEIAALTSGIRHAYLILRLQIPAGIKSPMGVVIEDVISPRWLHITPPEVEP